MSPQASAYRKDFTIGEQGIVRLKESRLYKTVPAGFYTPIHFQNRYVSVKSLIEKSKDPSLTAEQYFPMHKWNTGLIQADRHISRFLNSQSYYVSRGLPYHRNVLLFGGQGTGKSTYIHKRCRDLIDHHQAIIMSIENFGHIKGFTRYLLPKMKAVQHRLKVVVIEDVDALADDYIQDELMVLLNHGALKHNTLVLLTSSLPRYIPQKLLRSPSLIHSLIGVHHSGFNQGFVEAWFEFLMKKPFPEKEYTQSWFQEVKGRLAPGILKELFLYSALNQRSCQEEWEDLKTRKRQLSQRFGKEADLFEDEIDHLIQQDLMELMEALDA